MRAGVDTGGTFTDLLLERPDGLAVHKRLSTPEDPSRAILDGLAQLAGEAADAPPPDTVVHGSTVATNALLERKGARAILVTNAGFEDVLTIGRQHRPKLHALRVERPAPVIPESLRIGVDVRRGPKGEAVVPLTEAAVEETLAAAARLRPESAAVVLLHAYADGTDEARIGRALRERLGIPVTESHRLLPEYREYERTSTVAINAYVAPKMAGYLERLSKSLPAGTRLFVMQSSGGILPAAQAGEEAVHTILSGPAGGVVGAAAAARAAGRTRVVTFDMGGTSTDVSLVDGEPVSTSWSEIGGHPLRIPTLDIHTVGAGGGSLAWRDAGGALRVGPKSAGADPGPACYGRGGREPTVTDAHVVLGRLAPEHFLGGEMELDDDAAREAVGGLARTLGLTVERCAEGILRVACSVMARAIRRISLERGHDPRRFTLVTFGGAGGLHACELAAMLGMPEVLVPPHPGLLSAFGMLVAAPRRERARSVLLRIAHGDPVPATPLASVYQELTDGLVAELAALGYDPRTLRAQHLAELRYAGQSYELSVSHGGDPRETVARFHEAHARAFGYRLERDVEWVNARVRVVGAEPPRPVSRAPGGPPRALSGGVVPRADLPAGSTLLGPAVVTEYSSTTYLPPGWRLEVLDGGALSLRRL
ncbi:MAG: hydantoinase/oxoprolinase family protein [Deltaproteobacteria bacterium]|nr:MAG: hydantoinase/oxoprolinase family protein [Deltaproteobacteria bacterium]